MGKRIKLAAALAVLAGITWSTRGGDRPALATPAAAKQPAPAAPKDGPLRGDLSLRGEFDLAKMRAVGDRYQVSLKSGGTATLTLEPRIQKAAEKTLDRAKAPLGAIVVTDLDGRILALAGRRNIEPKREQDYALPLGVWAPAASVFKIVTSAALVDKGVNPKSKVCYHGGFRSVERSNLKDNPKRDTACADLTTGLAKSQNAIIAKLAHRHLSTKKLQDFAKRFGFDKAAKFSLSAETSRCAIPSEPFERAKVSAGFWKSELSPLGGAMLAGVIASGGKSMTPRIVDEVQRNGKTTKVVGAPQKRVIKKRVAKSVGRMMARAVKRGGTAFKGFHTRRGKYLLGDISVAGKTGSLSRREPSYLGYSWFVGYAPADNPKYVISVALGNPAKWHLKAHTAARLVLQEAVKALRKKKRRPRRKKARRRRG